MKRVSWLAAALLVTAASLGAQQRTVFVRVYGGGADHLADLTAQGPQASFSPGYAVGASAGVQLSELVALRGDFTFTRNPAWGDSPFAGRDVNRFYYGAQLEARYPIGRRLVPYGFVGVGAVSIDQLGLDAFRPTTKPALMYGVGAYYEIPRTRLELFGEVKGASYRWDMAGFDRTMLDVMYAGGLSYRLPFARF
jgi:hypothetical protein